MSRTELRENELLERLRHYRQHLSPKDEEDWLQLGGELLNEGRWEDGIEAIIISLEMRGMYDCSEVQRDGSPDTRPYILTMQDIIDIQIKESVMARREMEDAGYYY